MGLCFVLQKPQAALSPTVHPSPASSISSVLLLWSSSHSFLLTLWMSQPVSFCSSDTSFPSGRFPQRSRFLIPKAVSPTVSHSCPLVKTSSTEYNVLSPHCRAQPLYWGLSPGKLLSVIRQEAASLLSPGHTSVTVSPFAELKEGPGSSE